MPEFSNEMWQSFKQQFLSVIDWLLYSFDILYDSFRSKPMLYLFVFFPIFALVFFGIFNMFTRLVPLKSLFDNADFKNDNSMLKTPSGRGSRNTAKAVNLATAQKQQSRAAVQSVHAATAKANAFNTPGHSHAQAHGPGGFNRAGSSGSTGSFGSSGSIPSGDSTSYGNGAAKAAAKLFDKSVSAFKKKKHEKALEEEKRAKEAAKAEAEAQKAAEKAEREQLAHDKAFNYEDRLEMGRDFKTGDTFVKKTTYNTRTGEEVGYHVTTKHYLGKNDSEESD